jgi:chemotaxis protein CheD
LGARAASAWDRAGEDGNRASFRYHDRAFKRDAVKLLPGQYYATGDDLVLTTVLGSCVSACLRDTVAAVGGMNHFMLPEGDPGIGGSARYGSFAMEILVNELLKIGARRDRLEAKVFGGGRVLRGMGANNVGDRNVRFVRNYLALESIPIVAEDLGDDYARKLCFIPLSGQVFMRRLGIDHAQKTLESERAYGQRLRTAPVQGEVELFG